MRKLLATAVLLLTLLSACSFKTVLVAGNFDTYDDQQFKQVMVMGPDGTKGYWFDPGSSVTYENANTGNIFTAELDSTNNRIYIGGNFELYKGQPAKNIAVLDLAGNSLQDSIFTGALGFNGPVHVIARDPNSTDSFFVGGEFTTYFISFLDENKNPTINEKPAPGILKIFGNGKVDQSFNPGEGFSYSVSNNPARIVTVAFDLANNRVCFGGSFTSYKTVMTNNLICTKPNGVIIPGFNPGGSGFTLVPEGGFPPASYEGEVNQISFSENYKKIYVSGRFNRYNGNLSTDNLVRLDHAGNFEFNYRIKGHANQRTLFLLTEPDAIITGGRSYTVGNSTVSYNSLIKINRNDGNLIPEFTVTPGNGKDVGKFIHDGLGIAALVDGEAVIPGKLYFAGGFTESGLSGVETVTDYNLQEQRPVLRIDKETGAVDQDFNFSIGFSSVGQPGFVFVLRAIKTPLFP